MADIDIDNSLFFFFFFGGERGEGDGDKPSGIHLKLFYHPVIVWVYGGDVADWNNKPTQHSTCTGLTKLPHQHELC